MILRSDCVAGFAGQKLKRELRFTVDGQLATSRLLFLAEFLETRIIPERVEHRIEPE